MSNWSCLHHYKEFMANSNDINVFLDVKIKRHVLSLLTELSHLLQELRATRTMWYVSTLISLSKHAYCWDDKKSDISIIIAFNLLWFIPPNLFKIYWKFSLIRERFTVLQFFFFLRFFIFDYAFNINIFLFSRPFKALKISPPLRFHRP